MVGTWYIFMFFVLSTFNARILKFHRSTYFRIIKVRCMLVMKSGMFDFDNL